MQTFKQFLEMKTDDVWSVWSGEDMRDFAAEVNRLKADDSIQFSQTYSTSPTGVKVNTHLRLRDEHLAPEQVIKKIIPMAMKKVKGNRAELLHSSVGKIDKDGVFYHYHYLVK